MHFSLTGQYTPQAINSIMDNPTTSRYEAAKKLIEAAGGKLISLYSTPAEGPGVLAIFDVPDPGAAAAISGVVVASGALHHVKLTRLLTKTKWSTFGKRQVSFVAHTSRQVSKYVGWQPTGLPPTRRRRLRMRHVRKGSTCDLAARLRRVRFHPSMSDIGRCWSHSSFASIADMHTDAISPASAR